MITESAMPSYQQRVHGRQVDQPLEKNIMLGFAKWVDRIVRTDWDWWAYFDGPERVGKSTVGIWWDHYVAGPLFKITDHVVYDAEEFLRLVDETPRYGVIDLDEAAEAWFSRDYQQEMNKALIKASTQIGDRNLKVNLKLPSIWLLDTAAIRRHKTYVQVSAPGYVRGKSEWYKPLWKKYVKQIDPYWELKFIQYSNPLPDKQYRIYKEHKTRKAKERLAGYIDKIANAKAKDDPRYLADTIIVKISKLSPKKRSELLGSRGDYNRNLVKHHMKCPDQVAREVCDVLNNKMRQAKKAKEKDS